jgi:hypothetical protein
MVMAIVIVVMADMADTGLPQQSLVVSLDMV